MDDEKNPHTVRTAYSAKTYWKDSHVCGVNDDPDRVELKSDHNWPEITFELPRQRYELDKVERLMAAAYDRGKRVRSAEISQMFKNLLLT